MTARLPSLAISVFRRPLLGAAVKVMALSFGVVGLVLAAIAWNDLEELLRRQNSAAYDDLTWNITQVHLESLRFTNALLAASGDAPDAALDGVRLRFDILYSRLNVFGGTPIRTMLAQEGVSSEAYRALETAVSETTALIDGPPQDLRAALPDLVARYSALDGPIRDFTVRGNVALGLIDERERVHIARMLFRTLILTAPALLSLTILLVQGVVLNRALRRRVVELDLMSRHLNDIFDVSRDSIVAFDLAGKILFANTSVEAMFGVERSAAIGTSFSHWFANAETRESFLAACRVHAQHGRSWLSDGEQLTLDLVDRAGNARTFECLFLPVIDAQARRYFVAFLRDISAMLQAEADLTSALVTARVGEETQRRMVSVLGHELRSPLNALSGYLQLCLDVAPDAGDLRARLEAAAVSLDRAVRITDNALDYTALPNQGASQTAEEDMDLAQTLKRLVDRNRRFAEARGLHLSLSDAPVPDIRIRCDLHILSLAVSNLVHNAIVHTRHGSVSVSVSAEPDDDRHVHVRIDIADTGPGISPEDQKRIFDDFETLESDSRRTERGAGLGLSLVSRAMKVLDGAVDLQSQPGRGTTISLSFRAALSADQAAPPMPAASDPGDVRILVVEDNNDNMQVLTAQLAALGARADCARDGEEGAARARATPYDLIFMDVAMPGISGPEATRLIRESGASSAATIVATTAYSQVALRRQCIESGMNRVLTKPIAKADLAHLLGVAETGYAAEDALPDSAAPHDPAAQAGFQQQVSALAETLGPEKVRDLFTRFLAEMETVLADAALAGRDGAARASLAAELHKVAGSAAVFGLSTLREALLEAETEAQVPGGAGVSVLVPALRARLAEVRSHCLPALDRLT